jgi:hypothetical protein
VSFIDQIDEKNGIMVEVKRIADRKGFALPLADLRVTGEDRSNYNSVLYYTLWYINY